MNQDSPYFGKREKSWRIPVELDDFQSYGLWNSLSACDDTRRLLATFPAHDGDFFPESYIDHFSLLRQEAHREDPGYSSLWPVRVDIDITQRCTDNCSFCYSRTYRPTAAYSGAEISLVQFEEILKDLALGGTKSIRFTGGGEPLFHPQIMQMLPLPQKYGMRTCILTNGVLLKKQISKLLVSSIDHLRISINAAKDQTRQRLHRSTHSEISLSEIFRQLEYIAQIRQTMGPPQRKPLIWATFLLLPQNFTEICEAAHILKEVGVDSISFRPVYHRRLSRPFTQNELEKLHEQLAHAYGLHDPPNFQVFIPKRDIDAVWELNPGSQFPICLSCRLRTILEATNHGPMVKLCGLHRGKTSGILGLVTETNMFSGIWNSLKAQQMLAHRPQNCRRCIDVSMNVTLNNAFKILRIYPYALLLKSFQFQ